MLEMADDTSRGSVLDEICRDPENRWLVDLADFGWDTGAAMDFMTARERLVRKAGKAGVPRAVFAPFDPGRPGFEDRVKVLAGLPRALDWE